MAKLDLRKTAEDLKANWKKPREGEYLSIREFVQFALGGMGIYTASDALGAVNFAGTNIVVGMIFNVGIRDAYVIGLIGTILGFITMPLKAMITDNLGLLPKKFMRTIHLASAALAALCALLWVLPSSGLDYVVRDLLKHVAIRVICTILEIYLSIYVLKFFGKKYGKFKPHMVLFGVPSVALATAFTFMPYTEMRYSSKLIVVHLVTNLLELFKGPYNANVEKMQGLLSPNPQERMRIFSIAPIMGLARSIYSMMLPVLATLTGGQLNIRTYRWIVPGFGIYGMLQGLFIIKTQERVFQPRDFKPKVDLVKAAREVFTNKYLWIRNLSRLFDDYSGAYIQGVLNWIFMYGLRMEWMMGLMLNLSYITSFPGNLMAPWYTKRFSKRKSMLLTRGIVLVCQLGFFPIIFMQNDMAKIILYMAVSLIVSFFNSSFSVIEKAMLPDIWDYQQWRTGERLEASTDLFNFFSKPITMMLGFISPYFFRVIGLVRDWDILYDAAIRNQVLTVVIIIAFIANVLMTIPFAFYDLTPAKHRQIIEDLQERAAQADVEAEEGEVQA